MKNGMKIKNLVYSAMAIALVAVATMVIRIPSPKAGYINFGDIMIFVSAALLGRRTGFIAGGVGSAIADILSSYAVYAPGTFIIKGMEGFIYSLLVKRDEDGNIKFYSMIAAAGVSALWMVFGYFTYEYFLYGIGTAYPNVPANLIQGAVSAAASIPILAAVKKTGLMVKTESR